MKPALPPLNESTVTTAGGRYKWNMKAVAIPCTREFIYRDETQARFIPKNVMMVFYENSQLDIFPTELFQSIFRAELTSDPNISVYVKTVDITVELMKESFSVIRGDSFVQYGKPGQYLITETSYPNHQYIFTEREFHKYLTHFSSDDDDEGEGEEEGKDDDPANKSKELESFDEKDDPMELFETVPECYGDTPRLKFTTPTISNLLIGLNAIDSSLPKEIIQLAKFNNYPVEENTTYTWNVKNYSYVAIRIPEQELTIHFLDKPILSRSERFSGERGDYLICNTGGMIFAIVTPEQFELLFETDNTSLSNLFFIKEMRVKNLTAVPLQHLVTAYWCGSIEFGKTGDVLMQLELPSPSSYDEMDSPFPSSSPSQSQLQSPSQPQSQPQSQSQVTSNDQQFLKLINIYQWIVTIEEFNEHYNYKDDNYSDRLSEMPIEVDEMIWQEEALINTRGTPYLNPFENYNPKTPCWRGSVSRFIRGNGKGKNPHWKTTPAEIHGGYLMINPYSKKPRQFQFIQFDDIRDVTEAERLQVGAAVAVCGLPIRHRKRSASLGERALSFFSRSSSNLEPLPEIVEYFTVDPPIPDTATNNNHNQHIIVTQRHSASSSSHSQLTLTELKDLFKLCRAWTKRQQLYELFKQAYEAPHTITGGSLTHILTNISTAFPNELGQILTTPIDKLFGHVTLVHTAIQYSNRVVLESFYAPPYLAHITATEYHNKLTKRSYCCNVTQFSVFSLIKTPQDMFTSIEEEEGNTLLMLLCDKGAYQVITDIITQHYPSEEYLNIQNYKQQSLLSLALNLLLSTHLTSSKIQNFLHFLLIKKCNPNLQDSEGNTALHTLCFMFNSLASGEESLPTKLLLVKVIEDFIQSGSDIRALNHRNETPLAIFCQMKEDLEHITYDDETKNLFKVIDQLSNNERDLLNPTNGINCPLHICADRGLSKLLSHFISKGALIDLKNSDGERPLDLLIRKLEQLRQRLFLTAADRNILDRLDKCYKVVMERKMNYENVGMNTSPSRVLRSVSSTASTSSASGSVSSPSAVGGVNTTSLPLPYSGTSQDTEEEIENSNGIIFHQINGRYEIKTGEVLSLTSYLCWSPTFNEIDSRALVAAYPCVCDHEVFLDHIISLYDQKVNNLKTEDEQINLPGLFGLLNIWARIRQNEIEPLLAQSEFTTFANQVKTHSGQLLNQDIIQQLSSEESKQRLSALLSLDQVFQFHRPVSLNSRIEALVQNNYTKLSALFSATKAPFAEPKYFYSLKPEEVVQQFSLTMKYLFDAIPTEEFFSSNYNDRKKCPKIRELAKYKDTIKSYFIAEILRYSGMDDRVNTIGQLLRCVKYADTLYSNYELIEVIYLSLTTPPVYRLTDTFQLVQEKYSNEWNHFDNLTKGCCKLLHERMSLCPPSPPAVPYIGYYAKVMHRCTLPPRVIDIQNDIKTGTKINAEEEEVIGHHNEDGIYLIKHLNFQYFKIQTKLFLEIQKYQSIPYLYQYNEEIQRKIINCRPYPSEAGPLHERSCQLQPMKVMV